MTIPFQYDSLKASSSKDDDRPQANDSFNLDNEGSHEENFIDVAVIEVDHPVNFVDVEAIEVDQPVNDGVEHPERIMVLDDTFIDIESYMGPENFDILPEINETDRIAVLQENVQRNERAPTNDSVFVSRISVDDRNFARSRQ